MGPRISFKGSLNILRPSLDHRIVLVDSNLPGLAEVRDLYVCQLNTKVFGHDFTSGKEDDVPQNTLALVSDARRSDGGDLQPPSQLVYDESRQGLTFNILCNDE